MLSHWTLSQLPSKQESLRTYMPPKGGSQKLDGPTQSGPAGRSVVHAVATSAGTSTTLVGTLAKHGQHRIHRIHCGAFAACRQQITCQDIRCHNVGHIWNCIWHCVEGKSELIWCVCHFNLRVMFHSRVSRTLVLMLHMAGVWFNHSGSSQKLLLR